MRYIVITTNPITGEQSAFETKWFEPETHFNPDLQMVVVDTYRHLITFDGETWDDIEQDNL